MRTVERRETLREALGRLAVVPTTIREAISGLQPEDLVVTTRQHAPWGIYTISIRPAREDDDEACL